MDVSLCVDQDKLQKEQRNTAVNLLKLDDGWRTILRQTRNTELRKDLTVLRQTFGRQLDDLDSIIKVRALTSLHPLTVNLLTFCVVSLCLCCRRWYVT